MKKFLTTIACAITMLAIIPACGTKKVADQEPATTIEQTEAAKPACDEHAEQTEATDATESDSNDREDFAA